MSNQAAIYLAMGRSHGDVVTTLLQDISHKDNPAPTPTIVSESKHPDSTSFTTAQLVANELRLHDRTSDDPRRANSVTVVRPDLPRARLAASLGLSRRYQSVPIKSQASKFSSIRFRNDIVDASALLAIGSIGSVETPGSLAIGIWTQYLDPRLAFPLTHPARREPATADVAVVVSPTLLGTLLEGELMGYVVGIWSRDLVAAELAGLAVRTAALPDNVERIGPWEDPVVQRATELDLGAHLHSELSLYPVWTGNAEDATGKEHLRSLAWTVATLLNIHDVETVSPPS